MESTPMRSIHQITVVTSCLGVGAIVALGLLGHGGTWPVLHPARTAPSSPGVALHRNSEEVDAIGRPVWARDEGRWRAYTDLVERALAEGHVEDAVRVWPDAYGAALESRT